MKVGHVDKWLISWRASMIPIRKLAVHSQLERIRIEKLMAEKEITETSEGLSVLVDTINSLSPQNFRPSYTHNPIRYFSFVLLSSVFRGPHVPSIRSKRRSFHTTDLWLPFVKGSNSRKKRIITPRSQLLFFIVPTVWRDAASTPLSNFSSPFESK